MLVQVGPGTKGGELLRRYWQPFALAKDAGDLPPRDSKELSLEQQVLGDNTSNTTRLEQPGGDY